MSNLLVVGGFTESKRLLEPVAEEAVAQGFAHDAEVLTLSRAIKMDDERLRSLVAGMKIITHSAGVVALPSARGRVADSELPEDLVIIAGPEPRTLPTLMGSADRKTLDHLFAETTYPRNAHRRIVAGNTAELIAHFPTNVSLPGYITRFSTLNQLDAGDIASQGRLGSFMMKDDVFYEDRGWRDYVVVHDLQREGVVFDELLGTHDELLLDPAGVLLGIKSAFDTAAFTS